MRQRRLKNLDKKLSEYRGNVNVNPNIMKGKWASLFEEENPMYLELGCGKAQFILKMAEAYPERNFIGIEGNQSVLLRALQKCEKLGMSLPGKINGEKPGKSTAEKDTSRFEYLESNGKHEQSLPDDHSTNKDFIYFAAPNLIFAGMYIKSISDVFEKDELSGLYLNFSDPWPKERHAKRRLTSREYLQGYREVLKDDSFLEFKTDNENLFRFSIDEFEECNLHRELYSEDLHSTDFESASFPTEYEDKFSMRGHKIFFCRMRF